jgi:hypothetical protein
MSLDPPLNTFGGERHAAHPVIIKGTDQYARIDDKTCGIQGSKRLLAFQALVQLPTA